VKFLNAAQSFGFAAISTVRPPAFTSAALQLRPLALWRVPRSLDDDHGFLIFVKAAHDLPHEFPGWVIAAQRLARDLMAQESILHNISLHSRAVPPSSTFLFFKPSSQLPP